MLDIGEALDVQTFGTLDDLRAGDGVVQVDLDVFAGDVCGAGEEAAVFWAHGEVGEVVADCAADWGFGGDKAGHAVVLERKLRKECACRNSAKTDQDVLKTSSTIDGDGLFPPTHMYPAEARRARLEL